MLPAAGGYYVYARRAFGETVGFAVGWTDWLTYCAVLGYISIGLGEFPRVLSPAARADGEADRDRGARRVSSRCSGPAFASAAAFRRSRRRSSSRRSWRSCSAVSCVHGGTAQRRRDRLAAARRRPA